MRTRVSRLENWVALGPFPIRALRVVVITAASGDSTVILDQVAVLPLAPLDLPAPRDKRGARAAELVRNNSGRRIRLADVTRDSGASPRTLERLFKAETGLSFGAWCQRARMLRALQLLAGGDSVTATSISVGYESLSAFVAAFRRAFGTTPGRYFRIQDRGFRIEERVSLTAGLRGLRPRSRE